MVLDPLISLQYAPSPPSPRSFCYPAHPALPGRGGGPKPGHDAQVSQDGSITSKRVDREQAVGHAQEAEVQGQGKGASEPCGVQADSKKP